LLNLNKKISWGTKLIQEYNPNVQIQKPKMSNLRPSMKLNNSMGSENINPNLNNLSFAADDDD